MMEEVLDEAIYIKKVIVVGENSNHKFFNYHQEMSKASFELEAADTTKDDPAFWLYSSGTTGASGQSHSQRRQYCCRLLEQTS